MISITAAVCCPEPGTTSRHEESCRLVFLQIKNTNKALTHSQKCYPKPERQCTGGSPGSDYAVRDRCFCHDHCRVYACVHLAGLYFPSPAYALPGAGCRADCRIHAHRYRRNVNAPEKTGRSHLGPAGFVYFWPYYAVLFAQPDPIIAVECA